MEMVRRQDFVPLLQETDPQDREEKPTTRRNFLAQQGSTGSGQQEASRFPRHTRVRVSSSLLAVRLGGSSSATLEEQEQEKKAAAPKEKLECIDVMLAAL